MLSLEGKRFTNKTITALTAAHYSWLEVMNDFYIYFIFMYHARHYSMLKGEKQIKTNDINEKDKKSTKAKIIVIANQFLKRFV